MKRILHIVLVLLAAAACQGPRVIPKDTLTDIYTDMFLADQMVRDENVPRVRMDTLLLYEAVFRKYGYDTDDYLHSVRHYLQDPERFGKVFENVAKRLEGEIDALDKIIDHQNWVAHMMGAKRPQLDSILAPFSKESVYVGLARVARDTSRYPAWFRLVAAHEDTLMVPVDSLKAREDRMTGEELDSDEEKDGLKNSSLIHVTRSQVPVRIVPKHQPLKGEVKEEVEENE